MKPLVTAASVLVLFSSVAFAGVLPITGRYCNMNEAGVIVDANGLWSEDDAPFAKIVESGPGWWVVAYKGEFNAGVTTRISLSADKQTITLTDSDSPDPIVLPRCR